MADYTSTQNGDWSDDATWGGGGHPSANNDTAAMAHEVTYDMGDSAITWGNVTINSGGVLIFPIDADSTILFNTTGILTVNSGGELRAGTSGAPVDKAYHCYFHWPQGVSSRNVLVLNDGGEINIYGDADFYGSQRYASLDSNWTSGQTLYITGDFSALWQAGQKFYIHKNAAYNNYLTDAYIYTIDTVGAYDSVNDRTPITIVEAAPGITFTALSNGNTSELIMVSRNVVFCDVGATIGIGYFSIYTERIRFQCNQTSSDLVNISNALVYGWNYGIKDGNNTSITQSVFISNTNALYSVSGLTIDADIISNNFGYAYCDNCIITGRVNSNNTGFFVTTVSLFTGNCTGNYTSFGSSDNNEIAGNFVANREGISSDSMLVTGNFILNYYGIYQAKNNTVIGDFTANVIGVYSSYGIKITGDFTSNTTDISGLGSVWVTGTLSGGENSSYFSSIGKNAIVYEESSFAGVLHPIRIYENCGSILPLVSGDGDFQSPPSGSVWILQLITNSYTSAFESMTTVLSPLRAMSLYCDAGTYTLTIKIYPYNWTTTLDQDDIYIKASYLSGSGSDRATVQTSAESYANAGWRECTVTFTTGRAGIVYFNLYCTAYESGRYVLIDPHWIITPITATLDIYVVHGAPFKFSNFLPAVGTSLEGKIYATLIASANVTSLTSSRIWPQTREQNAGKPALVFFRAGGERDYTISDGYSNLENPRISIEAYATTVDARRELADAVITAMEASTRFTAIADTGPIDFYDPIIDEYKRIVDFSVWNHDT